jgi:GTP-binding protein
LLRALAAGRARSAVVTWCAFTTLNPVVGVVRVSEDGSLVADGDVDGVFYDETAVEERRERGLIVSGAYADMLTPVEG